MSQKPMTENETPDGIRIRRRKVKKDTAFTFRTTAETHEKILRVSELLSEQSLANVSMAKTIEISIDAIEAALSDNNEDHVRAFIYEILAKKRRASAGEGAAAIKQVPRKTEN